MSKKVVLAYSGGLDTSIIIPWLNENYGMDVIAMIADVGQGEDLDAVVAKAYATGAKKAVVLDLRDEFVRDYVYPTVRAGAIYEHKYLLGTSIARPVIAKHQVEVALKRAPKRWPMAAPAKATTRCVSSMPTRHWLRDLKVIAPWREWDSEVARRLPGLRRGTWHSGRGKPGEDPLPRPQPVAHQPRGRRTGECRQCSVADEPG